jgi:AsmA protein
MSDKPGKRFGILKVLAIIVVLLVIAIIALPFIIDANKFRPQIESELTRALGREVKLGNLKLSLLSGGIAVNDIAIADNSAFSRSPFVTAKSLQASIELKPLLFSKQIRITGISLEAPEITLIRNSSGQWNFSDLGGQADSGAENSGKASVASGASIGSSGPPAVDILIKQFKLTGGLVRVVEGKEKPSVYKDVNIVVRNLSFATSFPITLSASLPGGGKLTLEGKAGPLKKADALAIPLEADLAVAQLDLVASGFIPPDSGLSGLFDFRSTVTSDGSRVKSKGRAIAGKLQVVKGGFPADKPVSLDYLASYDLANRNGTLSDTRIEFGKAFAALAGNYEMRGDSLFLKMRLHGADMPIQDLTGLLPAFGVTLPKGASLKGGILNAELTAEGRVAKMEISGKAEIAGTRLVGFDLAGKMAVVATLAGIKSNQETEIEKFASNMKVTPDGIQVSNLLLIMPALGQLSGKGSMAADQSLNFTMQALLKPSGKLGAGLARLTKGSELDVPFFIRGTASDPKFVPDTKNAARSLLGLEPSGNGSGDGQANTGGAVGNALRNLLKKKKQTP